MIYLDNSATTKPCKEALEAISNTLENCWGNPSSSHKAGDEAHKIMTDAAKAIFATLGIRRANEGKIIFTAGGTEANNLAMLGVVRSKNRPVSGNSRGTIIITEGEHASVENVAKELENEGFRLVRVPTMGGRLDLEFLKKEASKDIIFASFMLVNNETGAIYDVKEASKIVKAASPAAVVHSDCVQAYMKMKFTPKDLGVDMLSVSAHKIFSAKGAGALYVAQEIITAKKIVPLVFGGGQGEGLRSGTEAVPAVAGFAAAATLGQKELDERIAKAKELSQYAIQKLSKLEGVRLNLPENHMPNIISMTVFNIKSETMLNFLSYKGICVSKSSACSTHAKNLSRALLSFGLSEEDTDSTLRVSLSHLNTKEEIDALCDAVEMGKKQLAGIKKR